MSKVLIVHVAETTAAIEAEDADLSVTLTARKVDGVPAWQITKRDENRGDSLAFADDLILVSEDGATFLAVLDDASEFPRILVSLS